MKIPRRIAALGVLVVAILPVGWSAAAETVTYPFFGVRHIARTEAIPRPLRMHIIELDLTAPELRFLVTPQSGPRDTSIQTTRQFLTQQGGQIAINSHFFTPFPDDGTGYTWLIGLGASSATTVRTVTPTRRSTGTRAIPTRSIFRRSTSAPTTRPPWSIRPPAT